jgi:hypothetical protein
MYKLIITAAYRCRRRNLNDVATTTSTVILVYTHGLQVHQKLIMADARCVGSKAFIESTVH